MQAQLKDIEQQAIESIETIQDEDSLQAWKVKHLGRNSRLMKVFDELKTLPKGERPIIGRLANEVKGVLEAIYTQKSDALGHEQIERALSAERLDVTLPGRPVNRGRLHPTTQTMRMVASIFADMGFQIYLSREVETDEFNFQLLNFPPHHPAREMQDTFFVRSKLDRGDNPLLMRTHTSPGQIHAMRQYAALDPDNPPPVRIILPGMCYRYEQITARSEMQFNQVEGLAVGHEITMGDLKGTLSDFARRMFGQHVRSRFRASHFPFTEPSAEMDIECFVCNGQGCSVCKRTGWLEILGCGMVHPVVLENGGYDPRRYTGFAFGMGPERIAMLRYRIEDIRYFWANDLRFLEQF
jgi:phenylalanyl-tRNA synthetase alpha chain